MDAGGKGVQLSRLVLQRLRRRQQWRPFVFRMGAINSLGKKLGVVWPLAVSTALANNSDVKETTRYSMLDTFYV